MNTKEDKTGRFYALLFRAAYINRWGLMRNNTYESLSVHSYETALLTHILAIIGNRKFHKRYDAEKLTAAALYHDRSEIMTGDMPTPVKYYNEEIKTAYKAIEKEAEKKLSGLIGEEYLPDFDRVFRLTGEEEALVKAADKLCAYIKCQNEIMSANREFVMAEKTIKKQLDNIPLDELKYFMENYVNSFFRQVDEVKL